MLPLQRMKRAAGQGPSIDRQRPSWMVSSLSDGAPGVSNNPWGYCKWGTKAAVSGDKCGRYARSGQGRVGTLRWAHPLPRSTDP